MVERAVPGHHEWEELSAPHIARYQFAAEFVRGKRVLDAGCGSGYGTRLLHAAGAASVLGIDIDARTVAHAERSSAPVPVAGLEFRVDDCHTLAASPGPFDVICNFENIEHLAHPEEFLAAAGERLAPGGVLVISTPDRAATAPYVNGRPRNRFHVQEWYREEFAVLLRTWFAEIDMRVQVRALSLQRREQAVRALREMLIWSNPLSVLLGRAIRFAPRQKQPWKLLQGLAAAGPNDFPVVPLSLEAACGTGEFHVALCRQPRLGGAAGRRAA